MNEKGIPWIDSLRANARQEFEETCFKTNSKVLEHFWFKGQDFIHMVVNNSIEKHWELLNKRNSSQLFNENA